MASLPTIPGVDVLTDVARSQLHVMQQIPSVLTALNTTMTRLADAIQQSNETMASVNRVTNRMDRMLDELEEPVVMMGPGLRRLAIVLDDPIITAVPDIIRTAQDDIGPQLRHVLEMQRSIQQSALQVTANLSEATKALAAIPGVSRVSGLLAPRGPRPESEEQGAASETESATAPEEPAAPAKKAAPRKRTSGAAKPSTTKASSTKASTARKTSSGGSRSTAAAAASGDGADKPTSQGSEAAQPESAEAAGEETSS